MRDSNTYDGYLGGHRPEYYKDPGDITGAKIEPDIVYIKRGSNNMYDWYDDMPDINANAYHNTYAATIGGVEYQTYKNENYMEFMNRREILSPKDLIRVNLGVRYVMDIYLKYVDKSLNRMVSIDVGSDKLYEVTFLQNATLKKICGRATRIVKFYNADRFKGENTQALIEFDSSYNFNHQTEVVDTASIRDIKYMALGLAQGDNGVPMKNQGSDEFYIGINSPLDTTKIWIDISDMNNIVARRFNRADWKWEKVEHFNYPKAERATIYYMCKTPPADHSLIWIDNRLPGTYQFYQFLRDEWTLIPINKFVVVNLPNGMKFPADTNKLLFKEQVFYYYNHINKDWEILPEAPEAPKASLYFFPPYYMVSGYEPVDRSALWVRPTPESKHFYIYRTDGWEELNVWYSECAPADLSKIWYRIMTLDQMVQDKTLFPHFNLNDIELIRAEDRYKQFDVYCLYNENTGKWQQVKSIESVGTERIVVNSSDETEYTTNVKTKVKFPITLFNSMFDLVDVSTDKPDLVTVIWNMDQMMLHVAPKAEGIVTFTLTTADGEAYIQFKLTITKDGPVTKGIEDTTKEDVSTSDSLPKGEVPENSQSPSTKPEASPTSPEPTAHNTTTSSPTTSTQLPSGSESSNEAPKEVPKQTQETPKGAESSHEPATGVVGSDSHVDGVTHTIESTH